MISSCLAAVGLAIVTLSAAQADTLQDIKARGKFICGTMGTAEPFSFQDPKTRAVVGYEVDICKAVADSLGVPLELKLIAVEARIPELIAGRVDVVAANLGWSPERAQQIDYSHQHFVSLQKVLAREGSGTEVARRTGWQARQRGARLVLGAGRAQVHSQCRTGDVQGSQRRLPGPAARQGQRLRRLRADAGEAAPAAASSAVPVKILEPALFVEPWGVGVRKGDAAMLGQVNQVLDKLEASGEATRIFDKWFGVGTPFNLKRDFRIESIKG